MNDKEQQLLARIIDLFATEFADNAILRGGMVLKILGSARYTNDLDYFFIPYKSKNEVVGMVINSLKKIENSTVKYSLNSKCFRIFLNVDEITAVIEIKTLKDVKSTLASTNLISSRYDLPKRVIRIVDHSISMANKLAAWNERRIVRDLYDIWFFLQLNVRPDVETLEKRLKKPLYAPLITKKDYFKGKTLEEFYDFVRLKTSELKDSEIEDQLKNYMTEDELEGLVPLIKSSFFKLR